MAMTPRARSASPSDDELDQRAAVLERIGDLQILVFDEDLGAGERRQLRRRQHRRAQHRAGDDAAGGLDVGDGDASSRSPSPAPCRKRHVEPACRPLRCRRVHSPSGRQIRTAGDRSPGQPCRSTSSRTPTIRPPSRAVRGRAGAPRGRLPDRFRHHRRAVVLAADVHLRCSGSSPWGSAGRCSGCCRRPRWSGRIALLRHDARQRRARPPSACG